MATERVKIKDGIKREGSKKRISKMKEKYGDVVSLIQDVDRKQGSLTLFKPDHNRMVFWLALAGLNEYEMASIIGVTDATLGVWKRTRPDFMEAMKAGRMEAVGTAAHSLFRVGNGYTRDEVKVIPNRVKEYNPDTGRVVKEYTEVLEVPVKRYYPPNVTALLKFLAAKYPEMWGDRSEVIHTSNMNHAIDATKLSKKKLKLLQSIAKSGAKADQKKAKAQNVVDKAKINQSRKVKKEKTKRIKDDK